MSTLTKFEGEPNVMKSNACSRTEPCVCVCVCVCLRIVLCQTALLSANTDSVSQNNCAAATTITTNNNNDCTQQRFRYLPEYHIYVNESPELAGELTRKEAGFIAEILTLAGMQAGKNVLVDGSLRDSDWYKAYFARLKQEYPVYRQAIIHVKAPREAVFQRAAVRPLTRLWLGCAVYIYGLARTTQKLRCTSLTLFRPFLCRMFVCCRTVDCRGLSSGTQDRAKVTGRVVPRKTLEMALEQVPRSVKILGPLVDYFCELNNAPGAPDIELLTSEETWESFERKWLQTCAWIPSRRKFLRGSRTIDKKLTITPSSTTA